MHRSLVAIVVLTTLLLAACGDSGSSSSTTTTTAPGSTSSTIGGDSTTTTAEGTTSSTAGETTTTTEGATDTTAPTVSDFDGCAAGAAYRAVQAAVLGDGADAAAAATAAQVALDGAFAEVPGDSTGLSELRALFTTIAGGASLETAAEELTNAASDDSFATAAFEIGELCPEGELAAFDEWVIVPEGTIAALAADLPGVDVDINEVKGRDFEIVGGELVGTSEQARFFVEGGQLAVSHIVIWAKSEDRVRLAVQIRQGGEFVGSAELRQTTRSRRSAMVFDVSGGDESRYLVKPETATVYEVRLLTLP